MRVSIQALALFSLAAGCGGRSELSAGGPRQLPAASRDAALVRRKSAQQIVSGLESQLGLTEADIFGPSYLDPPAEYYPARSPDAIPQISALAESNYLALGGPSWLKSKKAGLDPSTVFVQQLVPMSQAWCRLAVLKDRNPLLVEASLSDSSSSPQGRDRIRRNIALLHLRMLGDPAADADLSDLMDLFQVYEPNGSDVAWTAICAALVRHPLWITL